MKEKRVNWFTRNSSWLFVVLLVIDIVLLNFVIANLKLIIRFGATWETNGPLIVYLIIAVFIMLVTFFMLYFLIYLEDSLHDRNKKKIKCFEDFIQRKNLKGENN